MVDDVPFSYSGNHSVRVTNGEVSVPGFALGAAGTISMWARCTLDGFFQYLLDSETDRTLEYLNIDLDGDLAGQQEVTWINNKQAGSGSNWATKTTFPLGTWHHVAIVWNNAAATKVQIYYDATPVTGTTIAVNPSSQPATWYFGKRFMADSGGSWERWQGQIDEYAFWNKALSADEIAWLSTHSIIRLPEPGSLLLAATGLIGLLFFGWRKRQVEQCSPHSVRVRTMSCTPCADRPSSNRCAPVRTRSVRTTLHGSVPPPNGHRVYVFAADAAA